MSHTFSESRYDVPDSWFRRCGRSGLKLPAVSLGIWHNFGAPGTDSMKSATEADIMANCRQMLFAAFDAGITHIDAANGYGPPPGAAEERLGHILARDFAGHRDELVISSKAGFRMWPGPYGDGGTRKYLINSCDQSLKRLNLDYLDVFYHHRPDPDTPLEETLEALNHIVNSGRALYTGFSNYYDLTQAHKVVTLCETHGWHTPILHQFSYNMFRREGREELLALNAADGVGTIIFSPLAGGLLTGKYLKEIPNDSRAANSNSQFLKPEQVTPEVQQKLVRLNELASSRGQTLAQLALSWVLRRPECTSVLIGASRPSQVKDCAKVLDAGPLTADELDTIEAILGS